jgi:class 3 adenylate cyclase
MTVLEPTREDLSFPPAGTRCVAWQWFPEGTDGAPSVVLAYGYTGRAPSVDELEDAIPVLLPENVTEAIGSALGETPRPRGRFLTTVLVTDIVDSTATAVRVGDERWRDLLAEHYAVCRAQVTEHGGELVDTTGDGIVAIFDSPACAVRAASSIQAAARGAGLAVRAGVHTGECARLDDGVAGLAVHIAARVCALAGADEVATTGTVRDLAVGSLLAFEPHGEHELKGLPGSWPVFRASESASR